MDSAGSAPLRRLHELVGKLATGLAVAGGVVLLSLVLLTSVSIIGRSLMPLGLGPIPGDVELVEMGVAFVVFSCLAWCQYQGGHARVDLFKSALGRTTNWVLDVVANLFMLVIACLIAWRLYAGMLDKFEYAETTFILQLPLGWGYAGCLVGAIGFVLSTTSCFLQTVVHQRPAAGKRPAS